MKTASHPEPPVEDSSLLARVLVTTLTPVILVTPIAPRPQGASRWRAAREESRTFVAESWGSTPKATTRLQNRGLAHMSALALFVVLGLPGALIFLLGEFIDLDVVRVIGAVAIAAGALFAGLYVPLFVRSWFATADYNQWEAAGRPEAWAFRQASQPRAYDLVTAAVVGGGLAWFFLMLALG